MTTASLALLLLAVDPAALVERARLASASWLEHLPDFVCLQTNRRMASLDNGRSWRATSDYEVEVTYLQGRERYRMLRRNGVPVLGEQSADAQTLGSAGEFATALKTLFDPRTAAGFKDAGKERGFRRLSYIVRQENSRWSVGTEVRRNPGYHGIILVDEATGRVHKITMESKEFPPDFAVQKAAHATEYAVFQIAGQSYLLPASSIVEACAPRARCQRSVIEFTNYRKFSAESKLMP